MPDSKESALLAANAYTKNSANQIPPPAGWHTLDVNFDQPNGFSATVSCKGKDPTAKGAQIVIAFAGTNEKAVADFAFANIPGSMGTYSPQVLDAMKLYQEVKQQYPEANISFTGHSLGGGLASLMGVYFDRPATIFDAAPFEASTRNGNLLREYQAELKKAGYNDPAYNQFVEAGPRSWPSIPWPIAALAGVVISFGVNTALHMMKVVNERSDPVFVKRQEQVHSIEVAGEALAGIRRTFPTIRSQHSEVLRIGQQENAGSVNLHSITLLNLLKQSEPFAKAIQSSPDILKLFFDEKLYAADSQQPGKASFLDQLLIREVGGSPGILDRLADDLQKLVSTLGADKKFDKLREALTVAAMEHYHLKNPAPEKGLFTVHDGELRFQYSDIGASQYKSLPRLAEAVRELLPNAAQAHELIGQNSWAIKTSQDGALQVSHSLAPKRLASNEETGPGTSIHADAEATLTKTTFLAEAESPAALMTLQTPSATQSASTAQPDGQSLAVSQERERRIANLVHLQQSTGAAYTFGEQARAAINEAAGDTGAVNWKKVEAATITESLCRNGQSAQSVKDALCQHSPGAVTVDEHALIAKGVEYVERRLSQQNNLQADMSTQRAAPGTGLG